MSQIKNRGVLLYSHLIKCSRCGHENNPDALFCGRCALRLTKEEMEQYSRIHENLREFVSILKKHPKLKDAPDWVIEEPILKNFWNGLVEFVNSPEYKEKVKQSERKTGTRSNKDGLSMMQPNQIFNEAVACILSKTAYFRVFIKRRMSCEKWLQAEILHRFDELKIEGWPIESEAEKPYPTGKIGERCDIYFESGNCSHWVELESVVTNYCGKPGKPITDQIKHILNDIERLERVKTDVSKAYVLFVAYPFSVDGSDDDNWRETHLKRISTSRQPCSWEFNVERGMLGRIYLFQV